MKSTKMGQRTPARMAIIGPHAASQPHVPPLHHPPHTTTRFTIPASPQNERVHAGIDAHLRPEGTDSGVRTSRRDPGENGGEERSCRHRAHSRAGVGVD